MPQERREPKIAGPDAPKFGSREDFSPGGFTYPGKLVYNEKTISDREGKTKGLLEWTQIIEQQHRKFEDGNPGRQWNSCLLQHPDTGEAIFAGSNADELATAYEELIGVTMLPDDSDSKAFVGHYFRFESVKVPNTEKIYRQIPTEYLGPDYVYEGNVTVIGASDQSSPAVEEVPDDSDATSPAVAFLVDMKEEDVRAGAALRVLAKGADEDGVVVPDEVKAIKTVGGVSFRGQLTKGALLDRFLEEGLVVVEDGVIQATG